jgi:hypothetical protein
MVEQHQPQLYHRVPDALIGSILYPLNQLKTIYPDLYAREVSRYDSRKRVLQMRIPLLDCLWKRIRRRPVQHDPTPTIESRPDGRDEGT